MNNTFIAGRALLIGIGTGYPDGMKLPGVVRADAESLAQVLIDPKLCAYPKENVQTLLDEKATRANIIDGLNRLATSAQPNDTVFLFFSGHGGQKYFGDDAGTYICPVDFDWDDLSGTGIKAEELSTFISNIPAARVIVALDACHAEGAAFLKHLETEKSLAFGFGSPALEKLAAGTGRIVVASCKDNETSITYNVKGHSLFTYFLLEGLRGAALDRNDGLIRVLDLFHFVADEVPPNAKKIKSGHEQHPVLKAHAESNFPLALRKGGFLKSASGTTFQSIKRVDVRQLEKVLSLLYPSGPGHDEIWSRAGGDQSSLTSSGSGKANWHAAIRQLSQGGGGSEISLESLLETALSDYSNNTELRALAE